MKFLFKLSGMFKLLFILNIIFINQYEKKLVKNNESHLFDNLNINLHFPWYLYALSFIVIIGYITNLIVINVLAFKPLSPFSRFFYKPIPSRTIFLIEIILLICLLKIGYTKFNDAYSSKDYGILGSILKPFFSSEESDNLHLISKLEAINFILPVFASIIVLTTFWKIRNKNLTM